MKPASEIHKQWRDNNRERVNAYYREYRKRNPPQTTKERADLYNKIARSHRKVLPCAYCGERKIEKHHFTYDDPLWFMELCDDCHTLWHMLEITIDEHHQGCCDDGNSNSPVVA